MQGNQLFLFVNQKSTIMKTALNYLLIGIFLLSACTKKKSNDCDDGNSSELAYDLQLEEASNTVSIDFWDLDSDDDCVDHEYRIRVAPLYGAMDPQEIAIMLSTNHIVDVKFDAPNGTITLPGLAETDGVGNMMIYAALLVRHPKDVEVEDFIASDDFSSNHYKQFYFGVYPNGDVPDLSGCSNCNDEQCEDGSVSTCGCFNGFCFCRLCPDPIVW